MFLIFIRTFKESFKNFWRNGSLSVAAVSILALTLFIMSVIFVLVVTGNDVLKSIQQKSNITVYFKSDISEEDILKVKQDLGNYKEIKSADYVSKDEALGNFKKSNADNQIILKALEEIGGNPLLPSLVVKANDSSKYDSIANYISTAPFKDNVSRINYDRNKEVIGKLNDLVSEYKKIGLGIAILFSIIAILITFNTIRITIYTQKQEIEVMRLVGASNLYIRLPFIFEGITYALVASVISMVLLFLTFKFAPNYVATKIIPSGALLSYYYHGFFAILGLQILAGAVLGIFSGLIAIRKYLKI
ncbi:MAG TPA: permease-like cell division protein FtsX [Candidatus Moranbacteria bacterium]|nr:permease-like cell division protein FtsX [Candidatus Moranbacteria bacterium]